MPKSRLDFWRPKLEANAVRDLKNMDDLKELGWTAMVVWECELKDQAFLESKIRAFLA